MAKKPKALSPSTSRAQATRAERLRSMIRKISVGVEPANAPPKTPREITDEAARKKWEAAQKKRGS